MIRPVLAATLCLLPVAASAQPECSGNTQIEINVCAKDRWETADAELNRLWSAAKPAADARGHGQALLDSQREWLRLRDARCEPELDSGGSAAAMYYWSCMEEMTRARNQELRIVAQ